MAFLGSILKGAFGTSLGRGIVGSVVGGIAGGSLGEGGVLPGALAGFGLGAFPRRMIRGARTGIKYAGKGAWWGLKHPIAGTALGLGGYGAYRLATMGPDNLVTGQDASAVYATMKGTSMGVVSPVFEGSADGLVQGMHQGRHRG